MILQIIYYGILFLSLASWASFLTVVGQRTVKDQSFIFGRSQCDHCQQNIPAYALIPILGYLLTAGKCDQCSKRVDWRYPCLEFFYAAGILLILELNFHQTQLLHISIFSILFMMAAADHTAQIVPDRFQLLLLLTITCFYLFMGSWHLILQPLAASLLLGILLIGLSLLTNGGMGGADIKVYMIIALFFNWSDIFLLILVSCSTALIYLTGQRLLLKKATVHGVALLPHIMIAYPIFLYIITRP